MMGNQWPVGCWFFIFIDVKNSLHDVKNKLQLKYRK
ncbi:Uncharacterized protein BW664_05076 [Bacillus mycoides]|nr:Uncharacterized protein BW664_05076 [Bacillus mycoides]